MKTIAYLDCPSGISGDMCLGAVLDAGVPLEYLQSQLDRLGLGDEFQLSAAPVLRQGLRALKARVDLKDGSASEPTGDPSHSPSHSSGHSHSSAHSHATHSHSHHSHHHTHGLGQTAQVHSHSHASSHSYATSQATADDHAPHAQGTRHLPEIEALITQANLPERACRWSLAVFRQLAEAEAAVHGIPIDQVHFHEVGATDALVDIVGTCLGLDYLGIDELYCSALPTGQGRVKAAHGWLPVPAPAVLKLMAMRQMPIYSNGSQGEQVTPTGAALVAALAQGFGAPPAMTLQQVGLGAGQKDFPQANILRLWVGTVDGRPGAKTDPISTTLPTPDTQANSPSQTNDCQDSSSEPVAQGPKATAASPGSVAELTALAEASAAESPETPHPATTETVSVLETQVDDMVPQAMGYLYERLFEAGALDVFAQPIAMKKSRTGLLITVICHPEAEPRCTDLLFAETPTLGIRHRQQQRTILPRHFQTLATPYGPVTLKVAYHPQNQAVMNVHPEYEDCAALARQHGVPWQVVYHTALGLWYQSAPSTASGSL